MMRVSPFLAICFQCVIVLVAPDDQTARERRSMSMLRMGKRTLFDLPPLVPPAYDAGEDFEERELYLPGTDATRQVWIPRVGKDLDMVLNRLQERAPPYPRLGKLFEDYVQDYRRAISDSDDSDVRQVYVKAPRVGRSKRSVDQAEEQTSKSEQKRAVTFPDGDDDESLNEVERAFPRLGLYSERASPFPRLGFRNAEENDVNERASPFPRLGLEDRAAPFPRYGVRDLEGRASPFPRLGLVDKELAAPFPRYGLRDTDKEEEKRRMSMLRMGKRRMSMLRMGKRSEDEAEAADAEKRRMSMLRMGKRALSMLRMGRSASSDEEQKRSMSMLRMGKRALGMLRMGRSDTSSDSDAEKRALGMLRMGRSFGMLRMGRSPEAEQDKRSFGMLRMGKRDTREAAENAQEQVIESDTEVDGNSS